MVTPLFTPLRTAFVAGVFVSSISVLLCQPTTPPFPNRDGLLRIDVAVSDKSGKPVRELLPADFTLLDNARPTRIFSFKSENAKDSPAELILVLDEETLPPEQADAMKQEVAKNLRQQKGALPEPVLFYRISHDGVFSSAKPWLDGNLAAAELEAGSEPRLVWWAGEEGLGTLLMDRKGPHLFNEIGTLGLVAIDRRSTPGRKMLLWFGDASSRIAKHPCAMNLPAELSSRLREARITVNVLSMLPGDNLHPTDQDFIAADQLARATRYATLSIFAVAAHTGGLVYESWDAVEHDLERSAAGSVAHYSLTFDPPRTEISDEYHSLSLALSDPQLTARTPAGYYDQPVYWDHPRPNLEHVTVAQLEALIRSNPRDLLRRLDNMRLTERLMADRRSQLLSLLHNERERQALMAIADISEFAPPPPRETPTDPFPGHDPARAILERAFEYVAKTTHILPDFLATRTETEYQEPKIRDKDSCNMPSTEQPLRVSSTYRGTVLYRNGAEVVEAQKKKSKRLLNVHDHALNTRGVFGPLLSSVFSAAAKAPNGVTWSHWAKSERGNLAVFRYVIPSSVPVFEVTYCCLPVGNGTLYRNKAAYEGEFAVDPASGAIMRLTIEADLNEDRDPRAPIVRSQLMVEYAPVEIGGKQYISPVRSVSLSRGRTRTLRYEWGVTFLAYGPYEDYLNEYTFANYHKFGSEARILAGYEEVPQSVSSEAAKPGPAAKPH